MHSYNVALLFLRTAVVCNPIHAGPFLFTWWRHRMETFSVLLALCAGNSPVPGEFPEHRPATRSFDVFFDRRLNKWLSKQWGGWWFETQSGSLWRHCNEKFPGKVLLIQRRYNIGNVFSMWLKHCKSTGGNVALNQTGCLFQALWRVSLWRLLPWINRLPYGCWSIDGKMCSEQQMASKCKTVRIRFFLLHKNIEHSY